NLVECPRELPVPPHPMYRSPPLSPSSVLAAPTRAGVTLIEVLVCLMLLSLLAAAVFPVVTRRADREEPRRVAEDLSALGAAVERFAGDLDGALPSDLEDLAARPDRT